MKLKTLLPLLLFVIGMLAISHGSAAPVDTMYNQSPATDTVTVAQIPPAVDNDFSPAGAAAAIMIAAFALVCIGVGMMLAVVLLLIFFFFASAGIISASIVAGLNRRSFSAGFKVFFMLTSGFVGLVLSAGTLLVANKLLHLNLSTQLAIIMGGACGLVSGVAVGGVAYYIFRLIMNGLKEKINMVLPGTLWK